MQIEWEITFTIKSWEKHSSVNRGTSRFYTPIDLKRGVIIADGEMQINDSPLAQAYLQWLREVEARMKT